MEFIGEVAPLEGPTFVVPSDAPGVSWRIFGIHWEESKDVPVSDIEILESVYLDRTVLLMGGGMDISP